MVYLLAFIGGCTGCIGYTYLFHSLMGVMTVNTMIGVIEVVQNDIHRALFHIFFVVGFSYFRHFASRLCHPFWRA
jgi:uncharacterized membrane protein YoaK (UPF0700 family)